VGCSARMGQVLGSVPRGPGRTDRAGWCEEVHPAPPCLVAPASCDIGAPTQSLSFPV
jgi:hypothetical protein